MRRRGAGWILAARPPRRLERQLRRAAIGVVGGPGHFLSITGVLAIAAAVQAIGWIDILAEVMVTRIHDPAMLLIVMMVVVTITNGLLSAGPAAAAMLPLVSSLIAGPLASH